MVSYTNDSYLTCQINYIVYNCNQKSYNYMLVQRVTALFNNLYCLHFQPTVSCKYMLVQCACE